MVNDLLKLSSFLLISFENHLDPTHVPLSSLQNKWKRGSTQKKSTGILHKVKRKSQKEKKTMSLRETAFAISLSGWS
jgi:hypothetical protein